MGQYTITAPDGRKINPPKGTYWRVSEEKFLELERDGRIWWGRDGKAVPRIKKFLSEVKSGMVTPTIWLHSEVGTNGSAKQDLRDILFDADDVFITPKPIELIQRILELSTTNDDLVLDSFAGSGTTGHAVLDLNKQDGGNRSFILVEMDHNIAQDVTSERLKRVINGYDKGGDRAKPVEGLGGGFRFCHLGVPLFDEFGDIDGEVKFTDLAAHIFFSETGVPISSKATSELLGVYRDRAVYLLFDEAHAQSPREAAGNVLTPDRLGQLPAPPDEFEGTRVVYAEGCTVSSERLRAHGIVFKQIPYQVEGASA